MRILVTGDRNWNNESVMDRAFKDLFFYCEEQSFSAPLVLVEGCARGADQMAERIGLLHFATTEHHPADWDKYNKAAGVLRNQEMLDSGIDLCLAFHHDLRGSRGTADMVQRCLRVKVPVWLYG